MDVRHEKFNILTLMNYSTISILVFYTLKTKCCTILQPGPSYQYCIMNHDWIVC